MSEPDERGGTSRERRRFLQHAASATVAAIAPWPLTTMTGCRSPAPAAITAERARPKLAQGVMLGDVEAHRALLWTRGDRPARLHVEWSLQPNFDGAEAVRAPVLSPERDFTAHVALSDLPAGREVFVRAWATAEHDKHLRGEPVVARFRTPSAKAVPTRLLWSGDTVGQGFGINPDLGGMRIYERMRELSPDFFIHSGDQIYADSPVPETLTHPDGRVWRNLTTPAKSKVAETLDEYRGQYLYNLLDDNLRRFHAEVPQVWQWNDHEVTNNWSPGRPLDSRYAVPDVRTLMQRGRRAFREFAPMEPELPHIHRRISRGPHLDVFVLDTRSFRGPNSDNRQPAPSPESAFFGAGQLAWLLDGLSASRATWKVVACDMPLGLSLYDGHDVEGRARFEAVGNDDAGPPLGREHEVAMLLRNLKARGVRNVVWLTADIHYAAAHYYDPAHAAFRDFDGFWEFVAGPLHAASFGPAPLDSTFGPQVVFQRVGPQQGLSPLEGYQSFGQLDIDAQGNLTARWRDGEGALLFEQPIERAG